MLRQDVEDGEVYDGEWRDDKWNGKGVLKFAGGGKYIGDFVKHKLEGHGRVRRPRSQCLLVWCDTILIVCMNLHETKKSLTIILLFLFIFSV